MELGESMVQTLLLEVAGVNCDSESVKKYEGERIKLAGCCGKYLEPQRHIQMTFNGEMFPSGTEIQNRVPCVSVGHLLP